MQLISHKQGSPEWLEIRRKGIGASEAPTIMDENGFKDSPYKMWRRKMLGEEIPMNHHMRRGKENEEPARKYFENMTGMTFFPDMTYCSSERPWQIASLDGIDFDQTVIMEIKCTTNQEDHEGVKKGKVPQKYYAQVQHQLAVVEKADTCLYCSFSNGKGAIVEVKRDQAYIEKMLQKEEEFYECLVNGTTPELRPWDYTDMDNETWHEAAAMYKIIDSDVKRLEKEKEKYKNALISLSNGRPCKGAGLVLTVTKPLGLVDYKAIPELSNVNLDKYRKPSQERWTVRIA